MSHLAIKLPVTLRFDSGVLALIATLLIWASYFVALRAGATSALTSYDMAILRFMLPALLLLPVLYRGRAQIRAVKKRYLLGIACGAGLPFYLFSVLASGHVQAVVGSLLVPGVAPLFVTAMAVLCYREPLAKRKVIGLSIVLLGIAVLVSASLGQGTGSSYLGCILYVVAALCWAVYTVSVRLAKLSGLQVAAVLNVSAAALLALGLPFELAPSHLTSVSVEVILPQLMIMGLCCGLISVVTYGHAINRLGAELSICWGATTPIIVAMLAYSILGETLDLQTLLAMAGILLGVVCANRPKR
ncbi:MAG: DMT family transporter [Pseudomonadales bacterium]